MTAEEVKKAQEEINQEVINRSRNAKYDKGYILDGIADIEGYINSSPRIAWILKEAWDKGPGDWNLISEVILTTTKDTISATPSFKRVAYTSWGLQTDSNWDDIPWITQDENVSNAIKKIAWLNISKIAGDTTSPDSRITAAFEVWNDILNKQLDVFDPQVIILGNTFKWVEKFLGIENIAPIKNESAWAYVRRDGKVIIWTFHPSKIMKDQEYIDDIVTVLRKAREVYNLEF